LAVSQQQGGKGKDSCTNRCRARCKTQLLLLLLLGCCCCVIAVAPRLQHSLNS